MNLPLYNRAIWHLSQRAHGREELRRKLARNAKPTEVEEVLDALAGNGFLDDQEFSYLRSKSRRCLKHWGSRRIRLDLRRLGVDARIVELVLSRIEEEFPEVESLQRLIQVRIRIMGQPRTPSDLKRLYDHCIRLGYEPEQIRTELSDQFQQIEWC